MQFQIFFTCRNAIIFHILKHVFLLIIWCNGNSSVRVSKVKILRSIDGQVDRIRLPRQLCRTTSAQDIGCDVMQKRKGQSCSCTCNVTNPAGASLVKNTVMYNNGSWQCLGSSQVRQLAGCNILSFGEAIADPIPDISRKPIYVFKTPDQRCRVNALDSAYLKCNGTWKLLNESVLRRFVDTSRRFTTDHVVMKYTGVTESHPTVNGRVIRLAVSCRKRRQNYNVGCIVMKVKGKLICPLVASPKPTGTEVSTVTTATRNVKSYTFLTSPTPTDGTKVSNVTTSTRNVTRKAESPKLEHLHRPKEGASKKSIKKQDGFADETVVHSLAVIMGAFALVILVIVFVSAFVVMVMRKKLNSSNEENASNHDDDDDDDDLQFTF